MIDPFALRLAAAQGGTHALIDLDALAGNIAYVRSLVPAGTELMAVVKGNAYGHGLVPCGRAALAAGAQRLAVARVEEALLLRAAGVAAPILVLGPATPALARAAAEAGIALAVGSRAGLRRLLDALGDAPSPLALHLKVDTGMRRFGVEPAEAVALARALAAEPRVRLEGVFTHFATADEPDEGFLREQARRFAAVVHDLAAAGITPPLVHMANSAAILRGVVEVPAPGATLAVRPGLILYGLNPCPDRALPAAVRPVLRLVTRLGRVFTVPAGDGISYGRTYVAPRPIRCATLPIGYADGLARALSNQGWAVVDGAVCPIRGSVCMDQTVIEVEAAPRAAEGDPALLLSDGRDGAMTADQVAHLTGTISYEVVSRLAARVPRVYLRAGRPVAVLDLFGLTEADA
ncbi:MAG: alanine racemase [Sphaerobacter sp.]|nr:alanine racemase [Sphaerobacter sp.]